MAIPISIEGQKYFVAFPTPADFRTFKQYLARQLREEMGAAIPSGLTDEELKRRMQFVQDACDTINPFNSMGQLASTIEGAALLFHAWLRHENPSVTLDWVHGLIDRCEEKKPAALEGIRELRKAMAELLTAKKNEIQTLLQEARAAASDQPESTLNPSTSHSPAATA